MGRGKNGLTPTQIQRAFFVAVPQILLKSLTKKISRGKTDLSKRLLNLVATQVFCIEKLA
jgi:hypothetical protein